MKILALDVATKCGWATDLASGVWDLTIKRDESSGMRLIRFKAKVLEIIKSEKIDLVVFERTAGEHKSALIIQAELHGVLKLILEDLKINYRAYSAGEIKKYATGNGNASKIKMFDAAIKQFPDLNIIDDNHADALWLHSLALSDL